jgi:hypothetical protein
MLLPLFGDPLCLYQTWFTKPPINAGGGACSNCGSKAVCLVGIVGTQAAALVEKQGAMWRWAVDCRALEAHCRWLHSLQVLRSPNAAAALVAGMGLLWLPVSRPQRTI